jgi:DNA-binding response OmpR family regulator
MMAQKDILLLEDDYTLAQTIADLLESSGYSLTLVHTGNEAIDAAYEGDYKLYIFDINLPDMSGLDLLESLRHAEDKTPTLFISAMVDLQSIAKGFEVGAEDYIKKPFFPEELLIRVNARLKEHQQRISWCHLEYDPSKKVLYKEGEILSLGEVQQCLCDFFMRNIGDVLDKTILMECLNHSSDIALRVALNKLKQTTGLKIKNIRGIGYSVEKC